MSSPGRIPIPPLNVNTGRPGRLQPSPSLPNMRPSTRSGDAPILSSPLRPRVDTSPRPDVRRRHRRNVSSKGTKTEYITPPLTPKSSLQSDASESEQGQLSNGNETSIKDRANGDFADESDQEEGSAIRTGFRVQVLGHDNSNNVLADLRGILGSYGELHSLQSEDEDKKIFYVRFRQDRAAQTAWESLNGKKDTVLSGVTVRLVKRGLARGRTITSEAHGEFSINAKLQHLALLDSTASESLPSPNTSSAPCLLPPFSHPERSTQGHDSGYADGFPQVPVPPSFSTHLAAGARTRSDVSVKRHETSVTPRGNLTPSRADTGPPMGNWAAYPHSQRNFGPSPTDAHYYASPPSLESMGNNSLFSSNGTIPASSLYLPNHAYNPQLYWGDHNLTPGLDPYGGVTPTTWAPSNTLPPTPTSGGYWASGDPPIHYLNSPQQMFSYAYTYVPSQYPSHAQLPYQPSVDHSLGNSGITSPHPVPVGNQIDIQMIETGQDMRTTVMVKNIPNKMTDKELHKYIQDVCPRKIDFLYLRMDFKNGCNVGYAFVNFIQVEDLLHFVKQRLNKKWNIYASEKVLQMSYANYQGKEALVEKFKNSSIMDVQEEWRPKIYYSSGPQQGLVEPFPKPTHLRRKERSTMNRGALYVPGINSHGPGHHGRTYQHGNPSGPRSWADGGASDKFSGTRYDGGY